MRESEHKLGPIAFLQRAPLLGDDPIAHLKPPITGSALCGSAQRWCDLNQDLSKFWRGAERVESKWDLGSRNVEHGIFSATPKKRAK